MAHTWRGLPCVRRAESSRLATHPQKRDGGAGVVVNDFRSEAGVSPRAFQQDKATGLMRVKRAWPALRHRDEITRLASGRKPLRASSRKQASGD